MPKQPGSDSRRRLRHLALGSELAGGVLVPVLIGLWLDDRFDTPHTFVLIGTFIGLLALSATMFRVLKLRDNG